MSRIKNTRQKRAVFSDFEPRPADEPIVPEVEGVDFAPYQAWAQQSLGFGFNNPSLIVTALTHRSYVNEHRKLARAHNERLEFLGDAVLELVTTEYLFKHFDLPEGVLTSWRAALVRTESIRDAGEELGYAKLVRMSKGEQNGTEHSKLHIIANCFEATIGAVYLDQGFAAAKKIIDKHIIKNIDKIIEDGSWRDAKSYLQEISQRYCGMTPKYRVLAESGPDHDKKFTIGVFVDEIEWGCGEGGSKQLAQQQAAHRAIAYYKAKLQKSSEK